MFVVFHKHSNIFHKIDRTDQELFDLLDKYFTIHYKQFDQEAESSIKLPKQVLKYDDNYIYIPKNYLNNVINYLVMNGRLCNVEELDKIDKPKFDISEYWLDKFKNREGQLELAESIANSTGGVIQLPTGFGKSMFIVAVADSYKGEGNILITVPFNSIKEELISRFDSIGIGVSSGFDPNNKINIINAVGYCNSNNYDDPIVSEWMSKVDLLEIDECENLNDSLLKLLDNKLVNCKYIYGMSASSDKIDGIKFDKNNEDLFKLNESSYWITAYVGFSIAYKKPTKKVDLHIIKSTFGAKRMPWSEFMDFRQSIKNVVDHENFIPCLKLALENKRQILFIPINEIKTGEKIYDIVEKLGYDPILWSASGGIKSNHNLNSYDDIKNYCKTNKVDVLMASKVGFLGIDIPELSDCMLIQGTQFNTIVQPIGRVMRNDLPSIWLLEEMVESKNKIYRLCHYKRLGIIKKTYIYNEIIHGYDEVKQYL
jgi:hypothetical protein